MKFQIFTLRSDWIVRLRVIDLSKEEEDENEKNKQTDKSRFLQFY